MKDEKNSYIGQNGAVWNRNGRITEMKKICLRLNFTLSGQQGQSTGKRKYVSKWVFFFVIPGFFFF
jgi:hypothetical protein